jgi:ankyrin repeat protein
MSILSELTQLTSEFITKNIGTFGKIGKDQFTPLHCAVQNGNVNQLKQMLVNPNIAQLVNVPSVKGWTVLHVAVSHATLESKRVKGKLSVPLLDVLIQAGANVDEETDDGLTPLLMSLMTIPSSKKSGHLEFFLEISNVKKGVRKK